MKLICKHPNDFRSTRQIMEEIEYFKQKERYQNAIKTKYFEQTELQNIKERQLYVNLSRDIKRYPEITPDPEIVLNGTPIVLEGSLGSGESSAISVAYYREYRFATEDEEAWKWAETILPGPSRVLGTADIADELIQNNLLTDAEAKKLFGKRFRQRENRRRRQALGGIKGRN